MKVYLSSTLNDLGPERQAVKDALGGECTVFESYTADERSVRASCLADVAGCELYIAIIGRRYGSLHPGQTHSITELEYEEARRLGVPTLVFLKDDSSITLPFSDAGTGENPPERIQSFRQRLGNAGDDASRVAPFKTAEDLKSHVLKAYLRYSRRHATPATKRIEGRPYPGLRAFFPTESDRFFGRDAEVEALVDRLLARGERFLAVIGPSGSGKSSLVYAGLIPVLAASAVVGGVRWFPVTFSPRELGDDPFQPLAAALSKAFPDRGWRVPDLTTRLRSHPASIAEVAGEALKESGAAAQLLLFVDQFEEIFAAKVDSISRAAFFAYIARADPHRDDGDVVLACIGEFIAADAVLVVRRGPRLADRMRRQQENHHARLTERCLDLLVPAAADRIRFLSCQTSKRLSRLSRSRAASSWASR